MALVSGEAGGAVRDALALVNDEAVKVVGQVHQGAHVHGDAAPALEAVGVGRARGHAAALMVEVQAGRARRVAVRLRAAAQALAVATLARLRARTPVALIRAH